MLSRSGYTLFIFGTSVAFINAYWREILKSRTTLYLGIAYIVVGGGLYLAYSQWLETTRSVFKS